MARFKNMTGNVAVLLLGCGLALGVGEVFLRIKNPFGFRMKGNTLTLPANMTYNIEAGPTRRSDLLDPHIVHTKNSLGFRGPEPPEDFADHLTLIAVGGSTTECFYLTDGKDWPAQLALLLERDFEPLWLNNAGLDGHSTFGHLALLEGYLVRIKPKYVLFLVGINDVFIDAPLEFDEAAQAKVSLSATLAHHSEIFALGLNLWRFARTSRVKDLDTAAKPMALRSRPNRYMTEEEKQEELARHARRLRAYAVRIDRIVSVTRDNGIEPVLVTQPALFGGLDEASDLDFNVMEVDLGKKLSGEVAWAVLEKHNDVVRAKGEEHGVTVLDLAHRLPKSSAYFYDLIHFDNLGAERVAQILYEDLAPVLREKNPELVKGR